MWVDFVGFNVSKKNGKQYINSFPFDDESQVIFPNRKDKSKKISDDYQPPIEIDLNNTIKLSKLIPDSCDLICESGLNSTVITISVYCSATSGIANPGL